MNLVVGESHYSYLKGLGRLVGMDSLDNTDFVFIPAGLFRRLVACVVDLVFVLLAWSLTLAGLFLSSSGHGWFLAVGVVCWFWYFCLLWNCETPGKYFVGLKIAGKDGHKVGFQRALCREVLVKSLVLPIVGIATLGILLVVDYGMVLLDSSGLKRAGHDRLLGTIVIRIPDDGHLCWNAETCGEQ